MAGKDIDEALLNKTQLKDKLGLDKFVAGTRTPLYSNEQI